MKSSNFPCILLLKSKERTKGYGYDFENNRPLQKFQRQMAVNNVSLNIRRNSVYDGSIGSTFNEGHLTVEGEDAYCIDINTDLRMVTRPELTQAHA